MPKITDGNSILAKLQEFDERMNGALEAADIFIRIKNKADELEATCDQLQEIEKKWDDLRDTIIETIGKAHSAIHDIDKHLGVIEEKLHEENEQLLQEHIRIVSQSNVNTEQIADDREIVQESIRKVNNVLENVRIDLHEKNRKYIHEKFTAIENNMEISQNTFFDQQTERVNNLEKELCEKIIALKEDLTANMNEHQTKTDQQIVQFLAKQNVLVQNLSQQIDGFHRSTRTLLTEQQTARNQLNDLERKIENIPQKQKEQDDKINTFENNLLQLTERFNMTIEQLQGTRFIGKSFKTI